MLRFGSVFGLFGAAVPPRFPVLRGWLWGFVLGLPEVRSRRVPGLLTLTPAQPSPKPSPGQLAQAQPRGQRSPPKPAQPTPSPVQPSLASPAKPSPKAAHPLLGVGGTRALAH